MRTLSLLLLGAVPAGASRGLFAERLPRFSAPPSAEVGYEADVLRLAEQAAPANWPVAYANHPHVVPNVVYGTTYTPASDWRIASNPALFLAGSLVFAAALSSATLRRASRSTSLALLSVAGRPARTPLGVRPRAAAELQLLRAGAARMTATAPEVDEEVKTDSPAAILNRALKAEEDSETILVIVKDKEGEMNSVNVATALHRLATINKKKRVAREALFRDSRFALLLDAIDKHSTELQPRSVADVLWSLATLQHFPARLLKPVITSLVQALQKKTFEAQHLSTAVWALASLETRPMRLSGLGDVVADNATVPKSVLDVILVRIEAQAVSLVSKMNQQNCANLLWGFAKLDYQPTELLPKILKRLVEPGMLVNAKPVEVTDAAYALAELNPPKEAEFHDLTKAIAARASPDGILDSFSSRQLTTLMSAMLRLDAISELPEGRLDEWISAVRKGHEAKPMISADARNLEKTLATLGREASWVKRSEMLNNWVDMASGTSAGKARAYSDEELHAVFKVIDTDKSGDIDQDELLYAMQKINKDVDAQMVKKMLDMADSDGDFQVSFEEFKQIMVKQGKMLNKWVDMASGKARTPKKYSEEELLATFKAIDTDDSGDIDQRELLKAIQEINPAADARMVEKMLNFADADGDRQVSFDEFKQIMAKQSEMVVS